MSKPEVKMYEKQPKTLPKYVSKEVINELLDKAKKSDYRDYILLLTLWRTGMRVSDIVNLRKKDIMDDTLFIKKGKGLKDRVIPLNNELGALLGLYVDNNTPNAKVFNIKERQVRNIVYKYNKDLHPHTIRHSFAVLYLKSGGNLRSLQIILGHSNLNTTAIYLDLVAEDIKDDYKKIQW